MTTLRSTATEVPPVGETIETTAKAEAQQKEVPAALTTPDKATNPPRKRVKENQTPSPCGVEPLAELAPENALLRQQLPKLREDGAATVHQLRWELEEERHKRATAEEVAEAEIRKMKTDIAAK